MRRSPSAHSVLLPDLMLLLAAVIWGGGFVACEFAVRGFSPINVLMFRFCGAAVLCGLLFARRLRHSTRREVLCGALIGALQAAGLLMQLTGLQDTTPARQSFLVSGYLVFTPLLSWLLLRARPSLREVVCALLSLAGVACISLTGADGGLGINRGDALTLGYAVTFGVQIVLVARFGRAGVDVLRMTFWQFAAAGVLSLIASLIVGIDCTGADTPSILGLVYLAAVNTAVAMCLQNSAQKRTRPSHASVLLSLESLFGLLFSVAWFGDPVTVRMGIGCALMLAAAIASAVRPGQNKERSAPEPAQPKSC